MNKALLTMLLLASFTAGAFASSDSELKALFDRSVQTSDPVLKASLRQRILKAAPESAYGKFSKIYLLNVAGQLTPLQEVAMYGEVLKLDPKLTVAHFNRGLAYNAMGAPDKAAADFTRALEATPPYTDAYTGRADAYLAMGRFAEALADYERALQANPREAIAYINRGRYYFHQRRYALADADFSAALAVEPENLMALINRCGLYGEMQKFKEALVDCEKGLKLRPDTPALLVNRANSECGLKDYKSCIRTRARITELVPEASDGWSQLGQAHFKAGEPERALDAYAKAEELDPGRPLPGRNIWSRYLHEGRLDLAERAVKWLEKKSPADPQTDFLAGSVLAAQGRPEEAARRFTLALPKAEKKHEVLSARADAYIDAGKFALASADLKEAVAAGAQAPFAGFASARALYAAGDKAGALEAFKVLVSSYPDIYSRVNGHYGLSEMSFSVKKRSQGNELLELYRKSTVPRPGPAPGSAPTSAAVVPAQDQCYCVYYTGRMPPYFIAKVDQAWPGCENVKYQPDQKDPLKGLKNCDEFKKKKQ